MSVWRQRACDLIAKLTADLPADATLAQRRKALWGKGWEAHQGTRWGKKMWGSEVRKHLARHGDATIFDAPTKIDWPEHIHFPFREGML